MTRKLLIAGLFFALTELTNATTVSPANKDYIELGTPFNFEEREFKNFRCIDYEHSDLIQGGGQRLAAKMEKDASYEKLFEKLSGSVTAEVNFTAFKLEGGAFLSMENAASSRSQNFFFHANLVKKSLSVPELASGGFALTPKCEQIRDAFTDNGVVQDGIVDYLGDSFVYSAKYGAEVFYIMRIDYASSEDKEELSGYINGDFKGIISVSGDLKSEEVAKAASASVTVTAIQRGGVPTEMAKVIPNGVATCTFLDIEKCVDVFNSLVGYTNITPDDPDRETLFPGVSVFREQISDENDFSKLNIVSYDIQEYRNTLLQALIPSSGHGTTPAIGVNTILEDAENGIVTAASYARRAAEHIEQYLNRMSAEVVNNVFHIQSNANKQAFIWAQVSRYCFENPYFDQSHDKSCHQFKDSLDSAGALSTLKLQDRHYIDDIKQHLLPVPLRPIASDFGKISSNLLF